MSAMEGELAIVVFVDWYVGVEGQEKRKEQAANGEEGSRYGSKGVVAQLICRALKGSGLMLAARSVPCFFPSLLKQLPPD